MIYKVNDHRPEGRWLCVCLLRRQSGWWLMREQFVEETRLVQLVVMRLMADIALDNMFVNADGGDEVAACPERLFLVEIMRSLDLLLEPGR